MDKYSVIKKIGSCTPMLDETFEDKDAAIAYTNALRTKNSKWEYAIYQLCEGLLFPHKNAKLNLMVTFGLTLNILNYGKERNERSN